MDLWTSSHRAAAAARASLTPAALAYGAVMAARARAYRAGWRTARKLPAPAVGVGGLTAGGAGKTPVAAWVARWFAERGARPGILLRGYGGDEGDLHRELVPDAVVVEDADRTRGADTAVARGARALVLDDNFQHLRVRPDVQLLLVSVEHVLEGRRLLPAGPWREPLSRAAAADLVVLTRKTADDAALDRALRLVASADVPPAVARLAITAWAMLTGSTVEETALRGRPVLALCGITDPRPFLAHAGAIADVRARRVLRNHARYDRRTVARVVREAERAGVDWVLTTAKDAVKLRRAWPAHGPPVYVARLAVTWERGRPLVDRLLGDCLERAGAAPGRLGG